MKRIVDGGACPQVDSNGNIFAIAGNFVKKYDSAGTLLNTSANIGTKIASSRLVVSQVTGKVWVTALDRLYYLDTDLTTLQNIALPLVATSVVALDLAVDETDRGGGYTADKCWVVCINSGGGNTSKAYCYLTSGVLKKTVTITDGGYIVYNAYLCSIDSSGNLWILVSGWNGPSFTTTVYMYTFNGTFDYSGALVGAGTSDFVYGKLDAVCYLARLGNVYQSDTNPADGNWTLRGTGSSIATDKITNNRVAMASSGGTIEIKLVSSSDLITSAAPNNYTYGLKVTLQPNGNNVQKNIVWNPVSNQWITWDGLSDLDHCDLIFLSELSTPSIVPASGSIVGPTSVAISITELDADIRYTEDNSVPNSTSPVYGGLLTVATSETVKAIGTGTDYLISQVASETYVAVVVDPVILPIADTYINSTTVSITCATAGASIYYTTDGSAPDATKTLYTGAFTLYASATVKAIGILAGFTNSSIVSSAYVIIIQNVTDLLLNRSARYKVDIRWTNPTAFSSIVVRRKTTGNPANATDGDLVYSGVGNSFVDTVGYATYYYGVFVSNSVYYSTGVFDNINIPTPNMNTPIVLSSPVISQQNNDFFIRLKKNLCDENTYAKGMNAIGYTTQMVVCEGNCEPYVSLNVYINEKINQIVESDGSGNIRFGIKLQLGKNNVYAEYI